MPYTKRPLKHFTPYLFALFLLTFSNAFAGTETVVNVGAEHACALLNDGSIRCWGLNLSGQLEVPQGPYSQVSSGDYYSCGLRTGGTLECWGFEPPKLSGNFIQISAGPEHLCAIRSDNSLSCAGLNESGQATPPSGAFIQVSAGTDHSCGIRRDGRIACWGDNTNFEAEPPAGEFAAVSAGDNHTCAIQKDGQLNCWGANDDGEAEPPQGAFKQVSAGGEHNCAVRTDGTLVCWGLNNTAQASPPAGQFVQVSAAGVFSCAARVDGKILCWGSNDTGRLTPPGNGAALSQITSGNLHNCGLANKRIVCSGPDGNAQASPPDDEFIQVDAGSFFTCGLRTNGQTKCWGSDLSGQSSPPDTIFTQISAGGSHGCGLRGDGTIECWGNDADGQSSAPSGIFTQISAGVWNGCGLRSDGTAECWGFDGDGQSSPPSGSFSKIRAGRFHSCGIRSEGTAVCWGWDGLGQSSAPVGGFIDIAVGARHTCGIQGDGTLKCWGDDRNGESSPPGGTFTKLSAGFVHNCAIAGNGQAECWGFDGAGFVLAPNNAQAKTNAFELPDITPNISRLLNVSTLGATSGRGLEAGFIVQGSTSQRFVLLGEDFGGMVNPQLRLINLANGQVIEQNQRWVDHPTSAEVAALRTPEKQSDAGFAITLNQGLYFAELTDVGGSGGNGLVSVTATDGANFETTYPINISTRGPSSLDAGFIVFGTESRCFVIKAEGPFLNVGSSAVSDPALVVFSLEDDTLPILDANDNWQDHPSATLVGQAFQPVDSKEAALALRLSQGLYVARLYSSRSSEEGQDSIVSVTEAPESLLASGNCDTPPTPSIPPVLNDGPPKPDDPPQKERSLTAFINSPQAPGNFSTGQFIAFTATAKTEPDASISYDWDFDTSANVTFSSDRSGIVRYGSGGNKTIQVTTRANGLTTTDTITINVREPDTGGK